MISKFVLVVKHIDVSYLFREGLVLLGSRYKGGNWELTVYVFVLLETYNVVSVLRHDRCNFHESTGGCRSVVGTAVLDTVVSG